MPMVDGFMSLSVLRMPRNDTNDKTVLLRNTVDFVSLGIGVRALFMM